ncbi:endonuclease V [candidate division KSB1 bacterium]|nr:endonuclease V [candidate division KSB1 bacterium]
MQIRNRHSWEPDLAGAREIQNALQTEIRLTPLTETPALIAGADVAYSPKTDRYYAVVLLFELKSGRIIERVQHSGLVRWPYISGYLTFREGPILLAAFEKLQTTPDVIFFDGQGIAHPRRMGLAAHLGLFLERPCVGCAKKRLIGMFAEPAPEAGSWSSLIYRQQVVGAVVRTRAHVKPVFVSPGHLIDLPGAISLTLSTCRGYR